MDKLRIDKRDADLYALGAQLGIAVMDKDVAHRCNAADEHERVERFIDIAHAITSARAYSFAGVEVKRRLAHYLMRQALDWPNDIDLLTWAAETALHVRKESDRVCEAEQRARAA